MASTKGNSKNAASDGAKSSGKKSQTKSVHHEVWAFACLFLSIFTVFACFGADAMLINLLRSLLKGTIGFGLYFMPVSLFLCFVILLLQDRRSVKLRVCSALLFSLSIGVFAHLVSSRTDITWSIKLIQNLWTGGQTGTAGGLFAGFLALTLQSLLTRVGGVIVALTAILVFLLLTAGITPFGLIRAIRNRPGAKPKPAEEEVDPAVALVNRVALKQQERRERKIESFDIPVDEPLKQQKKKPSLLKKEAPAEPQPQIPAETQEEPEQEEKRKERMQKLVQAELISPPPVSPEAALQEQPMPSQQPPAVLPPLIREEQTEKVKPEEAEHAAAEVAAEIAQGASEPQEVYTFPPLALLQKQNGVHVDGTEEMRANAERLSTTLKSFNIDADMINVTRGPSVTRYELRLHEGIKLSKVTNLADDVALALGASGIRISAIPDQISVVGIEVPNRQVSTVYLSDVIGSEAFTKHKSKTAFAVGKDIGGNCIVSDISRLPHMLIAGTTGSGKSVCMNSLIISLLYKAMPEDVRLIMIDPKMVELGVYNGIPHLLIPVVTDPKKAAGALQWSVNEMMRRYRLMADAGVRDLESYNKVAQTDDSLQPLEQVVIVIDELADLMLVAAKEVEESICRVAQMGRAAGMHLVIATQRPSADVITGLMKANIPSRIAFAVASAMESRIILDTGGAEKLVGKGDMLYAPLGQGKPLRVQGCFVTDQEVQNVVDHIKNSTSANYSEEVIQQIDRSAETAEKGSGAAASAAEDNDSDELLPAAVEVILETGQASVSMLQRRLKLGYARAARIVDEMEERGYVGPFEGSKPRQLLITKEQWASMQNGSAEQPPVEDEIP